MKRTLMLFLTICMTILVACNDHDINKDNLFHDIDGQEIRAEKLCESTVSQRATSKETEKWLQESGNPIEEQRREAGVTEGKNKITYKK